MNVVYLERAQAHAPRWLDVKAYIEEFMRLSRPHLWMQILDMQEKKDPALVAHLAQVMQKPRRELGKNISDNNGHLYGFVPILMLAAVYGEEYYNWASILHLDHFVDQHWRDVLGEIYILFPTPVNDVSELVRRVRILFPPTDVDNPEGSSLYAILTRQNAFFNGDDHCPVVNPTLHFFTAFGQALQGEYGEKFAQQIQRPIIRRTPGNTSETW